MHATNKQIQVLQLKAKFLEAWGLEGNPFFFGGKAATLAVVMFVNGNIHLFYLSKTYARMRQWSPKHQRYCCYKRNIACTTRVDLRPHYHTITHVKQAGFWGSARRRVGSIQKTWALNYITTTQYTPQKKVSTWRISTPLCKNGTSWQCQVAVPLPVPVPAPPPHVVSRVVNVPWLINVS